MKLKLCSIPAKRFPALCFRAEEDPAGGPGRSAENAEGNGNFSHCKSQTLAKDEHRVLIGSGLTGIFKFGSNDAALRAKIVFTAHFLFTNRKI